MPAISSPLKFGLRFILICVLLLSLVQRYGEDGIKVLLPLFQLEINAITDEYHIEGLALDQQGADRVVRLTVSVAKPIFVAGQFLLPKDEGAVNANANASTSTGHVWQMMIICLAIMLAWPAAQAPLYFIRLAVSLPLLLIFTMLDVPLVLLASIWDLILQHFAPDKFSGLVLWSHLLTRGGRIALGLAIGAFAVWAAHFFRKRSLASSPAVS